MDDLYNQIEKLEKALQYDKDKALQSWNVSNYSRVLGMEDAYKLIKMLIKTNYSNKNDSHEYCGHLYVRVD